MKSAAKQYVQGWVESVQEAIQGWKTFWFRPADPFLLGMIRLLTGWMLVYNLLVWGIDLHAFFGYHGLQPLDSIREFHANQPVISFWFYVPEPWIATAHWTCVGIATLFFLGVGTRVTSVLAYLITISYSQRVPVANFGLDQILGMLCLYLAIGPSGACLSVDRWWKKRRAAAAGIELPRPSSSSARVALRMIQLHMCVIYFWAGVSKLKGDSWYTGEAMWQVMANQEYQTLDLTWLAYMPWVPYLVSHITVLWEIMFCVLVWVPKLRPLMLLMGAFMHFGIGAFLGMWTFGLIMTYAYFAFSDADVWRARLSWLMGTFKAPTQQISAPVVAAPATASSSLFTPDIPLSEAGHLAPATFAPVARTAEFTSTGIPSSAAASEPVSTTASLPANVVAQDTVKTQSQYETMPAAPHPKPESDSQRTHSPTEAAHQLRMNQAAVPPSAASVANFSPDRDQAARQPLAVRPQGHATQPSRDHRAPIINAPVILNQKVASSPTDSEDVEAAYLNPERALLLISLNETERNTLRRYFRDQDILCRAATTTSNGLTLATKIKPAAMVIAGTHLSPDNLLTLLEDLEDMANMPTLVLASRMQAQYLQDMGMTSLRMLVYPMSPAKIRRELMRMLFAPNAPPVSTQHDADESAAVSESPSSAGSESATG